MANRYWRGGTGTWDLTDTSHWSTTSGGAGGASVPTNADAVIFDNNSGTGTTTVNDSVVCASLTTTSYNGTISIANGQRITVSGNVTIGSGTTWTVGGGHALTIDGTCTLTSNGKNLGIVESFGVAVTLADALTATGFGLGFSQSGGSFTSANFAINTDKFVVLSGSIDLGTSTVTLTDGDFANNADGTSTTASATVKMNITNSGGREFDGGGYSYSKVWMTGAGSGAHSTRGDNTIGELQIDARTGGRVVNFRRSTTNTITTITCAGMAGNLTTLQSSVAGTPFTLSKSSGAVAVDYCNIIDSTAAGGATFKATRSIDGGGNTGWIFVTAAGAPPRAARATYLRM